MAAAALERATQAQSTVAFKSRVKDTDETLQMFADRRPGESIKFASTFSLMPW
jgi:hypothetical protein